MVWIFIYIFRECDATGPVVAMYPGSAPNCLASSRRGKRKTILAMTSFIISSHQNRPVPPSWSSEDLESPGTPSSDCPFCAIVQGLRPAHVVYETARVIALLDILPLRPGHTLVIPKRHVKRLSDVPPGDAAALGEAVTRVARALTRGK